MSRLAIRVADRIQADLPGFPGPFLPPLRSLCPTYGVSMTTLSRAIRYLADRGVLEVWPRKRIRLDNAGPPPLPQLRPFEALCRDVREGIAAGHHVTGRALPKIDFLAARYGVSNHSVRVAFALLEREGLLHKHGRAFLAGPRPGNSASGRSAEPVLLVVSRSVPAWIDLCSQGPTAAFGAAFVGEAERFGCRLTHIASHSGLSEAMPGLQSVLRKLGGRLLGTLLVGSRRDLPPGPEAWSKALRSGNRPVVWFDRNEEGLEADDRGLELTRCHAGERLAARACLEVLAERGHRSVAFVYVEHTAWVDRRLKLLEEEARRLHPPMRLVSWSGANPAQSWKNAGTSGLVDRLNRIRKAGPAIARRAIETLLRSKAASNSEIKPMTARGNRHFFAPIVSATLACLEGGEKPSRALGALWSALAMDGLLDHPDITCLIAPNDQTARAYHLKWLEDLEMEVPGHMSLIAFDNSGRFNFEPLASVDFGFEALGYKALHLLQGDIAIPRTRQGAVTAEPRVIQRGSVGRVVSANTVSRS